MLPFGADRAQDIYTPLTWAARPPCSRAQPLSARKRRAQATPRQNKADLFREHTRKARHAFAYDSQNAPCGSQGCILEIDAADVSGNVNSAKADEVEVDQRPMPPRTTPAQFTCPLTRRVRRTDLSTKYTLTKTPLRLIPQPRPPLKSASPHPSALTPPLQCRFLPPPPIDLFSYQPKANNMPKNRLPFFRLCRLKPCKSPLFSA